MSAARRKCVASDRRPYRGGGGLAGQAAAVVWALEPCLMRPRPGGWTRARGPPSRRRLQAPPCRRPHGTARAPRRRAGPPAIASASSRSTTNAIPRSAGSRPTMAATQERSAACARYSSRSWVARRRTPRSKSSRSRQRRSAAALTAGAIPAVHAAHPCAPHRPRPAAPSVRTVGAATSCPRPGDRWGAVAVCDTQIGPPDCPRRAASALPTFGRATNPQRPLNAHTHPSSQSSRIAGAQSPMRELHRQFHGSLDRSELHGAGFEPFYGRPRHLWVERAPVVVAPIGQAASVSLPRGLAVPEEFRVIRAAVAEAVNELAHYSGLELAPHWPPDVKMRRRGRMPHALRIGREEGRYESTEAGAGMPGGGSAWLGLAGGGASRVHRRRHHARQPARAARLLAQRAGGPHRHQRQLRAGAGRAAGARRCAGRPLYRRVG